MKKLYDLDIDAAIAEAIDTNPLFLQEEYIRIAPDLAYWGHRRAEAVHALNKAGHYVKIARARADQTIRAIASQNASKTTEDSIRAQVQQDQRVIDAEMAEIEAETKKLKLDSICEALRAKRDMLIQMGADLRAQMQGDPSLRAEHRQQTTFRDHQGKGGAKVDDGA